ncbi:MAG TPA: allophanate hydrolase subunit 1 [Jatrophihabitans sp.]|nr:allophanate hydrolase subunit 1 [Jatrophihabitans sp.]
MLPYGAAALLAEPADPGTVLALAAALRDTPGVVELVPAARTLLVRAAPSDRDAIRARLTELADTLDPAAVPAGPEVVLDVRYGGADLVATADELGLAPDELVHRHAAADYVVAFCGFAPGFAYLTGLDPGLHVPRLAQPRTRVPAGSVAIAGEFSAVYPRSSPGGWRLLGTTAAPLWDAARTPPALLAPGTRVRFRPR